MENLHGNLGVPKLSPQHLIKRGSFEKEDAIDSPLLRYLQEGSQSPVDGFKQWCHPLSSVENLMAAAARSSSVRAVPREEVLVMDGVLISTKGKRRSSGSSGSPPSGASDSSKKSLSKATKART